MVKSWLDSKLLSWSIVIAAATLFAAGLCSCSRDVPNAETPQTKVLQTNAVTAALAAMDTLTPEEREAELMDELLGQDKTFEALRHARNLMDSTNAAIRVKAVEAFAWIGKRALPEITEMMNDQNPSVAAEAMTAWEQAFSEIDGRHRIADTISRTVSNLKNPEHVNSILLHLSDIDQDVALPTLSTIIEGNKGSFVEESAREVYTHLTGGEIYESLAAAQKFLEVERSNETEKKQEAKNE